MRHCLELALQAAGKTSPNPMVGAIVLDREGKLVGEGFHARSGLAHAEKIALEVAGRRAVGGTLYTNLEPCKHVKNRRTSPCAPVVLDAGIARVVIGQADPIRAHGGGAIWLANRGVEVVRGVLEAECKEANRAFTTWARKGRPLYVLKVAASLDGKTATRTGESKWITGPKARASGRALRARLDAIIVGVETAIIDNPRLTSRGKGMRDPVRIVLDSRLRTPPSAKLLPVNSRSRAKVIIATTEEAPRTRERRLVEAGAEVLRLPQEGRRPCLLALSEALATRGIVSALVEGGAQVHGSFLEAGLCDELRLYLAPKALGGPGHGWLGGQGIGALEEAFRLRWHGEPERLGDDILLIARPR
ncbi:MAG: bifunctional diaminohydroxyphosphoribosylaminopyrimidine deaminase/5-amino-6-(5-phosphoribosylamino)uracil reductase RibD [Myxococcales bacterium]|nr:bifunctional diaminohydroxyphosphoribosylaminopyrimidine deaminase/5-amino-6-(5-phosphoribosylamino)uracil reductase RibD [Myxococcales bacterium]